MNKVLEKALNRSAPIDTPVFVNISDILNILENPKIIDDYKKSMYPVVSKISNICDFYTGNFMLPTHATITIGENNSKIFTFSPENYFFALIELFDGSKYFKDSIDITSDVEIFKKVKNDILSINSEEELKRSFPIIYKIYIDAKEANKNNIELDRILNDKKEDLGYKLMNYSVISNNFKTMFPNFDLDKEIEFSKIFSLKTYLERFLNAIECIIENKEEVAYAYMSNPLNFDSISEEDNDKINLYIAHQFMRQIELEEDSNKQRYLFYLTNYFKENVESKVTRVKIRVVEKNTLTKVTPISLYEKYKRLLISNPELSAVNFQRSDFKDMTNEEAEEFINAFLVDLRANWKILPNDDKTIDEAVKTCAARKYRKLTPEERRVKQEKMINLYVEKKSFFDSTDPYFRIQGIDTFDGYVGYIYSNSVVILEKYYDNQEKGKLADGEAIYIFNMKDFYELSRYSKTYLFANHLCIRVYHRGNWQKKVLDYINLNTNMSPVNTTNKLIQNKLVLINDKKEV